jgi:hypothetical protein
MNEKIKNALRLLQIEFVYHKKKILLLIILLMVIILVILILKTSGTQLQVIKFVDNSNNPLKGSVYIDNNYLTETNGYLKQLPHDFCITTHEISLVTKETIFSWFTYPSDCETKELVLSRDVVEIEKQERGSVTLKFMVKETREYLNGSLFFNNVFIANITGNYTIEKSLCEQIKTINLTTVDYNIEWQHQTAWCNTAGSLEYDNIEYSVSKTEVESLLNQS